MKNQNREPVIAWRLTPAAARRAQARRSDYIENGVNYGSPDPGKTIWMAREAALFMGWAEEDIELFAVDLGGDDGGRG